MRTSSRGLRPAVSMSTRSKSRIRCDGLAHLARRADDLHRQVDDVGVGAELLDGGDAVGVDGDQADAAVFAEAEVGGELGDGRRLADAGGADEGDDAAGAGGGGIGPVTRSSASSSAASRARAASGSRRSSAARGGGGRSARGRVCSSTSASIRSVKTSNSAGGMSRCGRRRRGRGVGRRGIGTRRAGWRLAAGGWSRSECARCAAEGAGLERLAAARSGLRGSESSVERSCATAFASGSTSPLA